MAALTGRLVALGSALAVAGAAQAVVNARLLRQPVPATQPVPGTQPVPATAALRGTQPQPAASVLVPARDEAAHIEDCLRALAGHAVLVLDDESSDGTGELARAAGARVIAGEARPPGWLGKPWACAQLVAAADPASEILVFVDADVRLAPGAVEAAVALLIETGLDVVCPFPRQLAGTAGERLVQPLLQWSWLTMLPLRLAERSPRPSLTAAAGQFLVVRRAALGRAGGFAAVRGAVLDDLALVRAVKASGGRGGVVDGTDLASCRMYPDWSQLRDGYAKSLWSAFGSEPGAVAVVALLGLTYVLPPLAALRGSRVGLAGYAAGVISRVVAARRTGGSVPDAFAHPASIAAFGYLTIDSVRRHRRGTLRWKGRPVEAANG